MLLTIQDESKQSWQVKLDLKASAWEAAGGAQAGSPLALFPKGRLVRQADGSVRLVTALWDLLLIDAPRTEGDQTRPGGNVTVTNSRVGAWDRGALRWLAGSGPEPLKESALLPKRTGNLRDDIVAAVRALMPCKLGDDKWDVIEPGAKTSVGKGTYNKSGTSCYKLPGWITSYAGAVPHGLQFKGPKRVSEMQAYMERRSLNGTTTGRTKGSRDGSWIKADGKRLPQRGDIYGLLDRDSKGVALTNRDTDYIGHVGVVLKATPTMWETADMGQGNGWEGNITVREYHSGVGELFGQTNQPGQSKFRIVAGWIDVERYFPEYARLIRG
ncbi:MAG: hypothetical protein U1F56_04825 [Rubrivivax sp.]